MYLTQRRKDAKVLGELVVRARELDAESMFPIVKERKPLKKQNVFMRTHSQRAF